MLSGAKVVIFIEFFNLEPPLGKIAHGLLEKMVRNKMYLNT